MDAAAKLDDLGVGLDHARTQHTVTAAVDQLQEAAKQQSPPSPSPLLSSPASCACLWPAATSSVSQTL